MRVLEEKKKEAELSVLIRFLPIIMLQYGLFLFSYSSLRERLRCKLTHFFRVKQQTRFQRAIT